MSYTGKYIALQSKHSRCLRRSAVRLFLACNSNPCKRSRAIPQPSVATALQYTLVLRSMSAVKALSSRLHLLSDLTYLMSLPYLTYHDQIATVGMEA